MRIVGALVRFASRAFAMDVRSERRRTRGPSPCVAETPRALLQCVVVGGRNTPWGWRRTLASPGSALLHLAPPGGCGRDPDRAHVGDPGARRRRDELEQPPAQR